MSNPLRAFHALHKTLDISYMLSPHSQLDWETTSPDSHPNILKDLLISSKFISSRTWIDTLADYPGQSNSDCNPLYLLS